MVAVIVRLMGGLVCIPTSQTLTSQGNLAVVFERQRLYENLFANLEHRMDVLDIRVRYL
jgi:hypothetical protein